MATIGSAKATLVNKIDSLTSSATAKDTIFLAKALKENTTHHSFTFMGAWAASTAYALDDVVTTSGKTYICILGYTSGSSFAVGSNWSIMAEKGTDGTTVGVGSAGQVLKTKSDLSGTEWGTDAGGLYSAVAILVDQKSNGTMGGTFTNGAWRHRDLNTVVSDLQGIAPLSSNLFTLQPGTYTVKWGATCMYVNGANTRLNNATTGANYLGTSGYIWAGNHSTTWQPGTVVVAVTTANNQFKIEHYCQDTVANTGFGHRSDGSNGDPERYTWVEIYKHA